MCGFIGKKLNVKNAYSGGFLAENEDNKYVFGEKMKTLLYKSVVTFFLGGLGKLSLSKNQKSPKFRLRKVQN